MSKKFKYGEEIIKFLEKYGYNKRGEDFEQFKDYATVTYMYAIPNGMRPQTPYVEFTVDADNDGFIFGEFFTDGRKGYSTKFDSVEDLEWFISNANYSNVDLTERKSVKESAGKTLTESKDRFIIYSNEGYLQFDGIPKENIPCDENYMIFNSKKEAEDFVKELQKECDNKWSDSLEVQKMWESSKKPSGKTLTESSDDVDWEILTKVPTSLQEYYWNYMQLTDDGWEKIAINDVFKKSIKIR